MVRIKLTGFLLNSLLVFLLSSGIAHSEIYWEVTSPEGLLGVKFPTPTQACAAGIKKNPAYFRFL